MVTGDAAALHSLVFIPRRSWGCLVETCPRSLLLGAAAQGACWWGSGRVTWPVAGRPRAQRTTPTPRLHPPALQAPRDSGEGALLREVAFWGPWPRLCSAVALPRGPCTCLPAPTGPSLARGSQSSLEGRPSPLAKGSFLLYSGDWAAPQVGWASCDPAPDMPSTPETTGPRQSTLCPSAVSHLPHPLATRKDRFCPTPVPLAAWLSHTLCPLLPGRCRPGTVRPHPARGSPRTLPACTLLAHSPPTVCRLPQSSACPSPSASRGPGGEGSSALACPRAVQPLSEAAPWRTPASLALSPLPRSPACPSLHQQTPHHERQTNEALP